MFRSFQLYPETPSAISLFSTLRIGGIDHAMAFAKIMLKGNAIMNGARASIIKKKKSKEDVGARGFRNCDWDE